ncbi:AraC family transcriptional regulator [Tenacibaculum holothuriorum]|uniref:AraC family transcriptional regulator n=1 Tax=Tenacibaculum holothuriorum TaxID=1635173 RepID=A0A1Y2PE06_9FLAO|nr:AraC family transcriptional regulator [Tenacibaculum holothuriorum]OSY87908.1 AraC family transcriptional regulator [Tenacibaculum holothuriorum]
MEKGVGISSQIVNRISKAIYFIQDNLNEKLSLDEVASKAHFSPYHFHRLFKIVTKETVNDFIVRKRVEKAASFLLHKKDLNITDISEKTGFSSLSSFSRAFKKFYGLSPAEFRKESPAKYSKICKTESKNGEIKTQFEQYICNVNNNLKWMQMNAKTEVKNIPELKLAYIAHQGKMDAIGGVYNRLMQWAYPKGLMQQEDLRMVTIYHDSPKITDPDKIRMSACMTLSTDVKADGEVGVKTQLETKCVVARLEIHPKDFQQAWESNFVWMSEHGFKRADKDPFGIYYNNPNEHPEGKCIVDLCIPVE